ncbi:MAG: patatin [Bacteroidetes bacterium]|nr:patatin [Bacteroidota bacterium]MBS1630892.1 patatin [Bacteroidota bacterium]
MKPKLRILLLLIALATVATGLIQVFAPGWVLGIVGASVTPTTRHFFAIVGMFMFLFGGLLIQALYSEQSNRAAIFWCGLQKLGASIAVFIGIAKGLFAPLAAAVAGFDLLSGILIMLYLRMKSEL